MSYSKSISHFLVVFFFFYSWLLFSQDTIIPVFNPRSPIDHQLLLSGSFGELRSNHFHAGIDIKSSQWNKSGDPVYAVEDGYISRINVRGEGYGNALYIDHPEGYTSVYGHLDRFTDEVKQHVKSEQYRLQKFSVNLFPVPSKFRVKKGDLIGFMGNTGRSSAAHLHFEIRHTKSEKPLNPYHFGIGPSDIRPPTLLNINISHLLPDTTIVDIDRYQAIYVRKGIYKLNSDTLEINAWRAGIEINGFDRMDLASNKNGIYSITMFLNSEKVYQYQMDSFSFDETRHLNAHINYMDFHDMKRRYQRCYILPEDHLSIYSQLESTNAIIPLYKDKKQKISIVARDFKGNESKLDFWLKRKAEILPPPPLHFNYKLKVGEAHLIRKEDYILYFPDSAFYQNAYLHIDQSDTIEAPLVSQHIFINSNNVFKNKVDIFIKPVGVTDSLLEKACIVSCGEKTFTSYGAELFEDYITTKITRFGDYAIMLDTIAPEIIPVNFSNGANSKKIAFKISDNLKTAGKARSVRYNAYIDGEWVLFEYDAKTKKITHFFENSLSPGEHFLRIELLDDRNNSTIYERKFIKT